MKVKSCIQKATKVIDYKDDCEIEEIRRKNPGWLNLVHNITIKRFVFDGEPPFSLKTLKPAIKKLSVEYGPGIYKAWCRRTDAGRHPSMFYFRVTDKEVKYLGRRKDLKKRSITQTKTT